MRKLSLLLILLLFSAPAAALELAGKTVPEQIVTDEGETTLYLNGAGIRSKFFFKIYIAELYLEHPSQSAEEILADNSRKRMVMHVLYEKVDRDKLVDGWNEGFAANLNEVQFNALAQQREHFNSLFTAVSRDEQIILDYIPGQGTRVSIAGAAKGTVAGSKFNRALLSIWLGGNPVTETLRQELLGVKK